MQLSKKIITLLAITIFGVATFVPSVEAVNSNANVTFEAPEAPPAILNPDNPDETPTTEQENERGDNVTGNSGVLTLDFVSDFNFGNHKLSAKSEDYYLTNKTTPFVQVTDVRGTEEGWRLDASMASFKDDKGNDSLPGATITLKNTSRVSRGELEQYVPQSDPQTITLSSDSNSKTITTANEKQGLGTWITRWLDIDENEEENESVILTVPAAVATEGAHTANITWTLYDAPNGEPVGTDSVDTEP